MENKSEIIMYTTSDGITKVNVTFEDETAWLSLDQMAELFQRDKSTISRHIKNIFEEGELLQTAVVAKFATTATDGKTYQVDFYSLDVIISVGYRVKSQRGVQFRIWATNILKEYMRKGFALDDDRLKQLGGGGYFKELLERIRDIRASEDEAFRRQGVAKEMVAFMKKDACQRGFAKIELDVWAFNASAIAFYEEAGFCETRRWLELTVSNL